MSRIIKTEDKDYLGALLKLIPSEVIAVNIFLQGVIPADALLVKLVVSFALIVITPFYLRFAMRVESLTQLLVSAVSAIVWFYSLGNLETSYLWGFKLYQPLFGSIALALWSLFPPMFLYKKETKAVAAQGKRKVVRAGTQAKRKASRKKTVSNKKGEHPPLMKKMN
jgi:hypothetical protein